MNRTEKKEAIAQYNGMFNDSGSVVVCHYQGLTVQNLNDLRARLREEGGQFTVTKNTLAKLAAKDTDYAGLDDLFVGQTGIVYSQDPVAAAKVAYNYAKDNDKLVILGGGLGAKVLDKAGVEALAKLPSLDEMRSKIVGLFQAPHSKFLRTINAPAQNMVGVLKAKSEKGE
jgi:large subunit ribosomal protein L10